MADALTRVTAGDYTIEPHSGIQLTVTRAHDRSTWSDLAFNDSVITRLPGHGVVATELRLRRQLFGYSKADGVISCTPSGSTAYRYSAGGPIVSPAVDAIVVSPVAPMAGIGRPIVLGTSDGLALTLVAPTRQAALEVDRKLAMTLRRQDTLSFRY